MSVTFYVQLQLKNVYYLNSIEIVSCYSKKSSALYCFEYYWNSS